MITTDEEAEKKEMTGFLNSDNKKEIIKVVLRKNPGFSYQAGYALFFSAAFAATGTVFIPIPVLGSALGAVIGGVVGAWWGKRQWEKQVKKIEEAEKADGNDALINSVVEVENNLSFINHTPIIGHAYQSIKWLSKKINEKFKEYDQNIMVADLTSGVGVAVGYEIGFMVGSFIAPGIGTVIGAGVGAVVGLVGGMLLGAKGSSLLAGKLKIEYDHQRIAAAGAIAGAGLGAAIGGLIGTFIFPGAGTAIGAAIGASVGAMAGGVYAGVSYDSTKKNGFLNKFSNLFSMGPGVSGGAMLGGILGTIVAPGLGTAVGAAIGAVAGASLAWAVTKYGNYLNGKEKSARDEVDKIITRPHVPSPDLDLADPKNFENEPKPLPAKDMDLTKYEEKVNDDSLVIQRSTRGQVDIDSSTIMLGQLGMPNEPAAVPILINEASIKDLRFKLFEELKEECEQRRLRQEGKQGNDNDTTEQASNSAKIK